MLRRVARPCASAAALRPCRPGAWLVASTKASLSTLAARRGRLEFAGLVGSAFSLAARRLWLGALPAMMMMMLIMGV